MISAEKRPNVSTLYTIDVDIPTLEAQISALNNTFANAINNGNISVSLTNPTATRIASVVFTTSNLVLTDSEVLAVLSSLRQAFKKPIQIDLPSQMLEASREMYEPSMQIRQISHTVADLPA